MKRQPNDFLPFYAKSDEDFAYALAELNSGGKRSHWIWYIFPQLEVLGFSSMAKFFGIKSLSEARRFLADAKLGPRLLEVSQVALSQLNKKSNRPGEKVDRLMGGNTDALKLRSSVTLFFYACQSEQQQQPESSPQGALFGALKDICEQELGGPDTATVNVCEAELRDERERA